MKRRDFMALFGAAALLHSLDARAQLVKVPTIGILGAGAESSWAALISAFRQRLGELGWIDGRTVTIVTRWAEGKSDRFPEIAAEFVQRNVDVILTAGSAIPAVKHATSTIPVVFAVAVDPLASVIVWPGPEATLRDCRCSQVKWSPRELRSFVRSFQVSNDWQYSLMRDIWAQRMNLPRPMRLLANSGSTSTPWIFDPQAILLRRLNR